MIFTLEVKEESFTEKLDSYKRVKAINKISRNREKELLFSGYFFAVLLQYFWWCMHLTYRKPYSIIKVQKTVQNKRRWYDVSS